MPKADRLAIGEAFASEAWHVFARLMQEAVAWLQAHEAARVAAAQKAMARAIGERAD